MSVLETIGVDLGGTKLLTGVVGSGADVLFRNVSGSQGHTQDGLLDRLEADLREALAARPAAAAIGLGVPCTIDRSGGRCVSAVHLPLADVPLAALIGDRLGLPTALDNDANLAALAEHRCGAAQGAKNVVMLTIGTGIGGGLIIDGQLYRGSSGAGAELGHIVIAQDGPACHGNCPNRGCAEVLASGTALEGEGRAAAERHPDSLLGRALAAGDAIDGAAVIAAARGGDAPAAAVVELIGRRIGVLLSGLANTFDPDVIVLGGGVMAAADLILDPARDELRRRALPPQNAVPVRVAELGEDAGMIGAALLALDELEAPTGVDAKAG